MARSKRKPVKVWRVGNFVLRLRDVPTLGEEDWQLTDGQIGGKVRKGEIGTVECLEASSLDGAWATRFMPGSMMETLVRAHLDGDEGDAPDREWLELVLTNLMCVSTIPNGHYHQALFMLTAAYSDPTLLADGFRSRRNKRVRQFRRDVMKLRDDFLAWRKDYDSFVLSQGEGLDHDLMAEKMKEVLGD